MQRGGFLVTSLAWKPTTNMGPRIKSHGGLVRKVLARGGGGLLLLQYH